MRILHIITRRQLRGAELFAAQLSNEFVESGHQVLIVALQSPLDFPVLSWIKCVDLNMDRTWRFVGFVHWKKLAHIIREWKPDIIQANASETLKFSVISQKLFGWDVPIVYRNANKVSDFIKGRVSQMWNKWLAHNVTFIISVSENCRLDFVRTFHISAHRTATIPIGTNVSQPDTASLARFSFPYWINVASLVPEKNHIGLLSIYKLYLDKGGKKDLVIVGDGSEKDNLIGLAKAYRLDAKVHFTGYRKDAVSIMSSAAGLLLPSLIEGLPGVILEAMAHRVPVIAYDVGGIPEIIVHKRNGFLIAKGNEKEFSEAMIEVEQDQPKILQMTEQAFQLCISQYSMKAVANHFLHTYKTILNARKD